MLFFPFNKKHLLKVHGLRNNRRTLVLRRVKYFFFFFPLRQVCRRAALTEVTARIAGGSRLKLRQIQLAHAVLDEDKGQKTSV